MTIPHLISGLLYYNMPTSAGGVNNRFLIDLLTDMQNKATMPKVVDGPADSDNTNENGDKADGPVVLLATMNKVTKLYMYRCM